MNLFKFFDFYVLFTIFVTAYLNQCYWYSTHYSD